MTRPHAAHAAEFADFTEAGYRELLRLAQVSYRFSRFSDASASRTILWRHDIDASVHRARRLAEIEAEEGVVATYFVFPRCPYYNLLSPPIVGQMRRILALGHDLALHFDPTCYGERTRAYDLIAEITAERDLLAREFGRRPVAVSFHNFGLFEPADFEDDIVAGMVNAYGRTLKASHGYVSDSNGVWRFRRLRTVLEEAKEERLQVLTHPEWWTPEAMPPRARLQRAIDGYAAAMGSWYDDITAKHGRPNIR
ncbi:MAG: hypothetical protein ACKVP3_11975 [Hyphomicrobiaceae bacterium]